MRIAIAGATGLIGGELVKSWAAAGHSLTLLSRSTSLSGGPHTVSVWDPAGGSLDASVLENQDLIVNLAGTGIADSRWTEQRKQEILESRTASTTLLAETIAGLDQKPALFVSASAIGFYGQRKPHETVDETATPGSGFLASVCRQWEESTQPAEQAGVRVVHLRIGIVLAAAGGALEKMLPLFRKGLGGRLGSGKQMMSWIALAEMPSVIDHLVKTTSVSGAVNLVSPQPVSNQEFTEILAAVLDRSAHLPTPAFVLKLLLGEMAEELVLGGAGVIPRKLLDSGYEFQYADLGATLATIVKQP